MCVLTGTRGEASTRENLEAFAVYIANLFIMTSDTIVTVYRDKDINEEELGKS